MKTITKNNLLILLIGFSLFFLTDLKGYEIDNLISDGYIEIPSDNPEEYENFLSAYIDFPLIWENASETEIGDLPLNSFLKSSLIFFHKNHKEVKSWNLFRKQSGFSKLEMAAVKLFIRLTPGPQQDIKLYNYNSLHKQSTYQLNRSQIKLIAKNSRGWQLQAITDQDRDERHLTDHINFALKPPELLSAIQLYLGSFRFQWGTGLFFNSNPMNLMGNTGSPTLYRGKARFRSYSGSDENRYFWGSAARIKLRSLQIHSFIAHNFLDCRLDNNLVTAIDYSGYHVSNLQVKNRDQLKKMTYGTGISSKIGEFTAGALVFQSRFNYPLQDYDQKPQLAGGSFFHQYRVKSLYFSGEIAATEKKKTALTETVYYKTKRVNIGLTLRYIPVGFNSFSGSIVRAFGGKLENEKGLYYFLGLKPKRGLKVAFYTDLFSRIVPANDGKPITRGTNSGFYLRKTHNNATVHIKLSRKHKYEYTKQTINTKLRLNITDFLELTNRLVYVKLNDSGDHSGIAFSHYFNYNYKEHSIKLGTTHYFSSNSDHRVYLYEPGIPLRFNMVSLSGSGRNIFLTTRFKTNQYIDLYFSGKHQSHGEKYYFQMQLLVAL